MTSPTTSNQMHGERTLPERTAGKIVPPGSTLLLVAGIAGLAVFYTLGADRFVLADPDEARCALIAREMLQTGQWLAPHLNGEPYFDKPPLYFWILAGSVRLFGENEWALRLPSAVTMAGLVGLTAVLAWQFFGRTAALLAAATFALSAGAVIGSRVVRMDMLLAFWVAAALVCWSRAYLRGGSRHWYLAGYAAIGLGCLTKGPVALVIPALVVGAYLLWAGRLRDVPAMRPVLGLGLIVLICGGWYAQMCWRFPGYAYEFFWRQHVARYAGSGLGRTAPWWYLPGSLLAALLPWTFLVGLAAWDRRPRRNSPAGEKFLWAWGLVVLGLFLPSRSRLPNYLLPMLPSTFALLGVYLAEAGRYRRQVGIGLAVTFGASAALLVAWPVVERLRFGQADLVQAAIRLIGLVVLAVVTYALYRRRPALATLPLMLGCAGFTVEMARGPAQAYFASRSSASLAEPLKSLDASAGPVIVATEPRYALIFYAPRGWRFELADERNRSRLKAALHSRRPVLAVLTGTGIFKLAKMSLGDRLEVLARHRRDALVRIHPAKTLREHSNRTEATGAARRAAPGGAG